jgi:branched-chain amino acid transport system ATP-binding protein
MALEVSGLCKSYGGVQAVRGIDFVVQPGECVALIGPNGAGKSTTFACIAGQQSADAGTVQWCGQTLLGLTPGQRLEQGIARTFQVAQTFEALPVLHNVALLLQRPHGWSAWQVLGHRHADEAMALLAQVGLQDLAAQRAGSLPYGARKRLELAMALAGIASPVPGAQRLLLLDEPAAGLAAAERQALMQLVRGLAQGAQTGLAVLYTEHNMDAVFGVADRVLVLMEGCIIAQGSAQAVAQNPVVQQRYLGSAWREHVALAEGAHA